MTLEEEVRELRRRVAELEAPRRYLQPIETPWMDSWRPIAKPVIVVYRTALGGDTKDA